MGIKEGGTDRGLDCGVSSQAAAVAVSHADGFSRLLPLRL
jgi:hypothetical protein